MKEKTHNIISADAEKAFDKIQSASSTLAEQLGRKKK